MKTIRKRISLGFLALTIVLFCAVVINVLELNRMRTNTEEIIAEGTRSSEYATRLLGAIQMQNRAVLNMVITNSSSLTEGYHDGILEFNSALLEAMEHNPQSSYLQAIYDANLSYRSIVEQHSPNNTEMADMKWFMDSYLKAYYAVDSAIKLYMTSPKTSVAVRMTSLEQNTYKTVTPSVLTLLVAVIIIALFYFFIDTYYTKPLRRISSSLEGYVKSKVPYMVKIEEKSELASLNENIKELITHSHKQQ